MRTEDKFKTWTSHETITAAGLPITYMAKQLNVCILTFNELLNIYLLVFLSSGASLPVDRCIFLIPHVVIWFLIFPMLIICPSSFGSRFRNK